VEYLVLRLIFINPVALPSMAECFLRKDFHFGMYLGFCFGQVLTRFFKWSLWTLILAFTLIITLTITFETIHDEEVLLYINFVFLMIAFIVIVLLRSCLTSAEKKLVPTVFTEKGELRSPEQFNICFNER